MILTSGDFGRSGALSEEYPLGVNRLAALPPAAYEEAEPAVPYVEEPPPNVDADTREPASLVGDLLSATVLEEPYDRGRLPYDDGVRLLSS